MSAREVQWQSKLNHMRNYPAVHKWEKRWISKGSMMVFKWVRKAEKCEFRRQAVDAAEGAAIDEGLLGAELEVGQRRLTRGKAADMGVVVEAIPDISEQALLGRSVAPRKTDEGAAAKGAGGGGDTSRKRQRDNDEDEDNQTVDAAHSKKPRGDEADHSD